MYTAILRLHVKDKEELARRTRERFLPKLRELPGFLGYHLVEGEGDTRASILVFKTREDGESAWERVRDYSVEQGLHELLDGEPEVIVRGETILTEWREEEREERRAA